MIVLRSRTIGVSTNENRFFFTVDGARSFVSEMDTGYLFLYEYGYTKQYLDYWTDGGFGIVGPTAYAYSLTGHLPLTLRSVPQTGASRAFLAPNAETVYRVLRVAGASTKTDVLLSRDSGLTYTVRSQTVFDRNHAMIQAAMRDTNEIWTCNSVSTFEDTTLQGFLAHSTDAGESWEKIYPFGNAAGLSWFNTRFAQHGIVLGSSPGTLFLLYNDYHSTDVDHRAVDILWSTDDGSTWHEDSTHVDSLGGKTDLLYNPSESELWSVLRDRRTLCYSSDFGAHWNCDSTTFRRDPISFMMFKGGSKYAVTWDSSNAKVFKYAGEAQMVARSLSRTENPSFIVTLHGPDKVTLTARRDLTGQLRLTNLLGSTMWQGSVSMNKGESIALPLTLMSHGIFFVTLTQSDVSESVTLLGF